MPNLPRQEPFFGDELEPIIAHRQMPAGAGEPIDAPDESIGEYLRKIRERTGKTVADISHALKIMSHHLIAIENNSFEDLPGRAYAIGFVRSYAACLGLDAGALVARLKAEWATPDVDLVFASPDTLGRGDQTGIASVENGSAEALSTEAHSTLELGSLAVSAQATLQSQLAKALLRFKGIAKVPSELKLRFPSPVGPIDQRSAAPAENGNASEPSLDLFSEAGHRDQARTARAETRRAARAGFAFSAPRRTAPLFSPSMGSVPLPSPPEHPVRNWITVGIMGIAVIYFGSSMLQSGRVAAPPPVIPVPARMAAEAGFVPEKVVPPAVATLVQPAQGAPEPASVPSSSDGPPAVAAVEKRGPISREATVEPPTEAVPAQPVFASAEPKHIFRGQLPLGERYGEQNRGSRVTLRVHRPTLIAVLGVRNHKWIDRVLRAGDTYRVPNMRGLKLTARDAGAVEVILDGNTVGFAGGDGAAVKGMSLQPQSIISRFHWLQE